MDHILGKPRDVLDGEKRGELIDQWIADADRLLDEGNLANAIENAEQAVKLAERASDRLQEGCAYIRKAEAYRSQQRIEEALECYRRAEKIFFWGGHKHHHAVTQVYIAEVYFEKREWSEAIQHFTFALDDLAQLKRDCHNANRRSDESRYDKWTRKVKQAWENARGQPEHPQLPPPPMPPDHVQAIPILLPGLAKFGQLPIHEEPLPAGLPRDLSSYDYLHERLAVKRLFIHDRPYDIYPISESHQSLFASENSYAIIPVCDDSMDKRHITNGDFVALRLLDNKEALADDVIIAFGLKEEREIRLRQVTDGGRHLQTCSTSPKWLTEYIELNDDVFITGIVIAVLKPANSQD